MIKPTIDPGPRGFRLVAVHSDAALALQRALDALALAAPDPDDYARQPQGAFVTAQREHRQRVNCLRGVLHDLSTLSVYCAEVASREPVSTCGKCGDTYPDPDGDADCPRCHDGRRP